VDDISFDVNEGEILGFLGPNGAGKTTTLNMLSTLLKPTSGTATVNGFDVIEHPDEVRRSIGYVFQDPTLDIELTGRENLDFHGRLYGMTRTARKQRIAEVLKLVQLEDRADDFVKTFSGGMKRRLEIARGLLHHPKVLFLDEPTLGLDPQTRRAIWEHIQRLNLEKKVTIILTTHYTEEADFLSARILIIDLGKIVALDKPQELKSRLKGDIVSLTLEQPVMTTKARSLFEGKNWVLGIHTFSGSSRGDAENHKLSIMRGMAAGAEGLAGMGPGPRGPQGMAAVHAGKMSPHTAQSQALSSSQPQNRVNLLVDDGGHRIPSIVKLVDEAGIGLESVELHKPTLDDVFISVTGRNIRDEQGSFMGMIRRYRIMQQARGRPGRS
jgi:ABC-2 type transport system ATP-binding protein